MVKVMQGNLGGTKAGGGFILAAVIIRAARVSEERAKSS